MSMHEAHGARFTYTTHVTLRDADAAGVLFFARYFALAHDAYEAFLREQGLGVAEVLTQGDYVLPVVHAEADYKAPLRCGDPVEVVLWVTQIRSRSFRVHYELSGPAGSPACVVCTAHVAVDTRTGRPRTLPPELVGALRRLHIPEP